MDVRPAAVAGSFYPASPSMLAKTVHDLLAAAGRGAPAKALVVPHAGYVYSGPIAATAFACVPAGIERVVLFGPAHRVYVRGLVSPGAARMATPLGEIVVENYGTPNPDAHAREHCLEVMLPFLQVIAPRATVVPVLASDASPEVVGAAIESLWGADETLIVISSDLSHYHAYDVGRALDTETAQRIVAREYVDSDHACGAVAINGMSWLARKKGLAVELLELKSSGDTAGDRREVVGYGAFAYRGV